jgi:hypothetical protein
LGVVSLQPWYAYKQTVTQGAQTDEMGLGNSADTSALSQLRSLASDPPVALERMGNRPLEMLGFKTPQFEENPLFGLAPFTSEQRCGKLYWAETMPGPVAETSQLLQPTCKSRVVHAAIGLFIRPGAWLYHASSLAFLLAIPLLLIARRWEVLVLGPPILLLFMYSAINASNDRYAFPIYPIGVALLAAGLRWLTRRLRGADAGPGAPGGLRPPGHDLNRTGGDSRRDVVVPSAAAEGSVINRLGSRSHSRNGRLSGPSPMQAR